MKNRFMTAALLTIILVVSLGNIVFWGIKKEGYHTDELYSYEFVSCVDYPDVNGNRPDMDYLNTWHDSSYFEDYLIVSDQEAFDIGGVINCIKQDVHPPLYYILLELSCSVFSRNSFSKWTGICLNMLFFIFTLMILYRLSAAVMQSSSWSLIVCLLYGIGVGAVNTVVFIRMYMMLTCACLLFLYANILLLKHYLGEEKRALGSILLYFFLIVSTIFGMMIQYYFLIFAFFVCLVFWIIPILKRQWKSVIAYAASMAAGLLISTLLWPEIIHDLITGQRGKSSLQHWKANASFKDILIRFMKGTDHKLFGGYSKEIVLVLLVLGVICIVTGIVKLLKSNKKSKETEKKMSGPFPIFDYGHLIICQISIVTVLFFVLIIRIAPWKEERYIMNLYPLMILVVVYLLKTGVYYSNIPKAVTILAVCGLCFCVISGYKEAGVSFLYQENKEKIEIIKDKYSDMPAFYITKDNPRAASSVNIPYFRYIPSVYPIKVDDLEDMPRIIAENWSSNYLVFVSSEVSDKRKMMNELADSLGGKVEKDVVFRNSRNVVYSLSVNTDRK